jgi:hypothetical protein
MKNWLKRKKAFPALIVIIAAVVAFCGTKEQSEKTTGKETGGREASLVLIYERNGSTVYYDRTSITRPAPDRIRVWLKQFETTERAVQKRKEAGLSSRGYEAYFYTLALFELDCPKRTFEELDYTDYNNTHQALHSGRGPERTFPVEPGTSGELLYQALCAPAHLPSSS